MNWKHLISFSAAIVLASAMGCSGDDDDDDAAASSGGSTAEGSGGSAEGSGGSDDGSGGDTGATLDADVAETIAAEDGGTVETESGAAAIELPADALSEDTEITIEALAREDQPDAENLGSNAFVLGPEGTEFDEPVTVTLTLDVDVPEDMTAVLAVLEDGEWVPIEGSTMSGSSVSAEVTHFSTFAILFVDDQIVIVSLSENCEDFSMDEIAECEGGEVVGTWSILDMCGMMAIAENPYGETEGCEDSVYLMNVDWDATLEFMGDGTWTSTMNSMDASYHVEASDACLEAYYQTDDAAAICAEVDEDCAHADGLCTCDIPLGDETSEPSTSTGTYEIDGNTITMTNDEDTEPGDPAQFCVSGDRLTIAGENEDGVMGYILERL
jgi:hypothetical protein